MLTAATVRSMDIREVVNDPDWQELRQSFVGRWTKDPVWCVGRLYEYFGVVSIQDVCPLRLRRILILLTGTGFRTGMIAHPEIDLLREAVRFEWRRRLGGGQ